MRGSKWNSQSERYSKEETTCIYLKIAFWPKLSWSLLWTISNNVVTDITYTILYQYLLCTTCHTQTKFPARMLTNTPSPAIFCTRFCSRPRPAPRHAARSVAKCSSAWSPASFNRFDASDANRPLPRRKTWWDLFFFKVQALCWQFLG